jgi:hypothetical protein
MLPGSVDEPKVGLNELMVGAASTPDPTQQLNPASPARALRKME